MLSKKSTYVTRFFAHFSTLSIVLFVSACGVATNESSLNIGTGQIIIEFPASLDRQLSESTEVIAKISVDGGSKTELSIDRNKMLLTGKIDKVSKGDHDLKVFYYYRNTQSGVETLIATTDIHINVGDRQIVALDSHNIVYLDDDRDGVTNLAEIQLGTDLNDPQSTPPAHGSHASQNYAIKDNIISSTIVVGTTSSTNYTIK